MTLKRLTWWDEFRVADESTDIRGWRVLDGAGGEVGAVADLIFDPNEGRVRYATIDLDDHLAAGTPGERADHRGVLVPIGEIDLA